MQNEQKVITVEPGEWGFAFLMMDYIANDGESSLIIQIFSDYRYYSTVSLCYLGSAVNESQEVS